MNTIVIDIPPESYRRLAEQARAAGKAPDVFTLELVETALEAREESQAHRTREVLVARGRIRPLSDALRRRIVPGVTLEQVRAALSNVPGPSLSEVILQQRGPRP